jgi:hypothetical protein
MPRAKKSDDAGPATPPPVQPDPDTPGSEEVMVVLPADEPVRCGGHILTEDGWVVEDGPVSNPTTDPATDEVEPDATGDDSENEQE